MKMKLKIWRQKGADQKGYFKKYEVKEVSEDMSFLEMMDLLNEDLIQKGEVPIEFDHDCREGICGTCCLVIDGRPHGPQKGVTTCQLYMRNFEEEKEITVEPFRSRAFPLIKDLVVDRSSLDRIQKAGGYISVNTGSSPDANAILVSKTRAEKAFTAAACIGCGACVAACKNASANLFTAAKISHLNSLPQGQVENESRVLNMVKQMDQEGFGACSVTGACSANCPKDISLSVMAEMNRLYMKTLIQK